MQRRTNLNQQIYVLFGLKGSAQKWGLLLGLFIMIRSGAGAQDLDQIGKGEALKLNGGLSFTQLYNTSFEGESRRDPYNYYLNGNLNFSIYGLSIPLTFNFSNQKFGFQQPFNQYGISPTYKWITLKAGYTSMSFSPYTLSGHLFLGGGVELRPEGPWQVSAMAGRLQKAIAADTTAGVEPMFERFGYGSKVAYSGQGYQVGLILFKSKDDPNSLPDIPEGSEVFPEENMVIGLNGSATIYKRFSVNFDYGQSALTRNLTAEEISRENFAPFPTQSALFAHRSSTAYLHAIKGGINYGGNGYTLGLGYERVDPGYRTHGAYFFNNDLESYTVNAATQLFKNKVSLAGNVGLQRDNLNDDKLNQMTRGVGAFNINWTASEKLSMGGSYSNFQSYTVIRSQFEDINTIDPLQPIDTLNFTQVSQSFNTNSTYILKVSEQKAVMISANLSAQQTNDEQNGETLATGSTFYNGNLGLVNQWKAAAFNLSTSFNMSWQEATDTQNMTLGPVISANKSLMDKKLRLSFSTAFNASYLNGQQENTIINARLSANYTLKEKHNFSLSNAFINRNTRGDDQIGATSIAELNGTLTYSYQF